MANNYRLFSETILNLTKEEEEWLNNTLMWTLGEDKTEGEYLVGLGIVPTDLEYWPDFDWNLSGPEEIWFYSEEFGNLENLAELVRAFLAKFRPNDSFSLSWADTCSKSRPGEFGGGALFITAEKIEWLNTTDWLSKKEKAYRKGVGGIK